MGKRVCLRDRDIEFLMFLSEYGIIKNENVKLFYNSEFYYKNRLASLAKGEMVERLYGKVGLGRKGKSYLNKMGFGYRNINRDDNYKKRMERVSDISCKIQLSGWSFEPSWRCEVNTYTKRGNRYVGVMSRYGRGYAEKEDDFFKRSYIVYYLHYDISPRELKYILREITRNKNRFRGLVVFTEENIWEYHKKFEDTGYIESYLIPYDDEQWEILKCIKDEQFMQKKVYEVFGEELLTLRCKTIFEEFYLKDEEYTTYVFYMPFLNFDLMHYINFVSSDRRLFGDVKSKMICLDNCIWEARKYLDKEVEVVCVEK